MALFASTRFFQRRWLVAPMRVGLQFSIVAIIIMSGCKTKHEADPQTKPRRIPVTAPPRINKHLYPPPGEAPVDLASALSRARREHKRVLLDFGSDWCGDCQVLDIYFHKPPNDRLLMSFVKVNINVGHIDTNLDIAQKYGVQLDGVPALAVLDANGRVLVTQGHEFSNARYMESSAVTEFLSHWKSQNSRGN